MPALQIRNLPEDVHRKLKVRAAERGQSLSEYAAQVLRADAETLTNAELWARIQARGQLGQEATQETVDIIRAHRESNDG